MKGVRSMMYKIGGAARKRLCLHWKNKIANVCFGYKFPGF